VFEKVGYFPDFGTVLCESGPFRIVFNFFVVRLMVCSVACNIWYGFQFFVSAFFIQW
jgi:hypothetical protein